MDLVRPRGHCGRPGARFLGAWGADGDEICRNDELRCSVFYPRSSMDGLCLRQTLLPGEAWLRSSEKGRVTQQISVQKQTAAEAGSCHPRKGSSNLLSSAAAPIGLSGSSQSNRLRLLEMPSVIVASLKSQVPSSTSQQPESNNKHSQAGTACRLLQGWVSGTFRGLWCPPEKPGSFFSFILEVSEKSKDDFEK